MTTVDCQREKGEGEREREGEGKKYPIHQKETLLNPDEFRIILGQCLEISISLPSNRLNSARVCWKRAVEVEESNLGRASFFFFFLQDSFFASNKNAMRLREEIEIFALPPLLICRNFRFYIQLC